MNKILLWILNTFCNGTPCKYGLINNIEAYEKEFLKSTLNQSPEITLAEFLSQMDKMDECMKSGDDCSISSGVVYKGSDILLDELSKDLPPNAPKKDD